MSLPFFTQQIFPFGAQIVILREYMKGDVNHSSINTITTIDRSVYVFDCKEVVFFPILRIANNFEYGKEVNKTRSYQIPTKFKYN